MADIVNCSHCGSPVPWSEYGDHIELWHGNWGRIQPPSGMPELSVLEAMRPQMESLKDEIAILRDRIEDLQDSLDA